jgi:hypothetical protein
MRLRLLFRFLTGELCISMNQAKRIERHIEWVVNGIRQPGTAPFRVESGNETGLQVRWSQLDYPSSASRSPRHHWTRLLGSTPYDRLIFVGASTVGALDSFVYYDLPFELIERSAGSWGNELQLSHGTGRLYEFLQTYRTTAQILQKNYGKQRLGNPLPLSKL